LEPKPEIYTDYGFALARLGKPQDALAAYQKALELDPKQEQAALGLGWAYQYTKEYDKAIAAYTQAIQIDPKEASADANLGIAWCYFFKRQLPEARAAMDKAAAAGRSVAQLKENVDKLEKAMREGQILTEEQMARAQAEQQAYEDRVKKIEAADNAARSRNATTRARAAKDLASLAGPSAVPTLIFLMQSDPNYDVRISACQAIGSLGPAARQALPNIDGVLRQPAYEPPINATAEQLEAQMKDGDYRRALRDAKARIGGR